MLGKKAIGGIVVLCLAYCLSNRNCCSKTKKEGKIVETKLGSVQGIISVSRDGREFYEWLGIPYAKPPVGELRFASPQPVEKWDGVRDGSSYGNVCAQMDLFSGEIHGHEDCLTLHVHVPKKVHDSKKLHPVMFWIHGGYFMCGSAKQYRPDFFMDEDIVVVSINYRVGALGFLNTGDSLVRGNMGLKDQSLALKWVNDNIANFGGDPNQITIFGESAGSVSVHYHLLSPKSQGLMQRAIAQSGTALNVWALNEDPIGQAKRFGGKLNCPTEPPTKMVECLKNVDISDILELHKETMRATERTKAMVFVPTVEAVLDEETFLGDQPINIIKAGKVAKIPFLIGFNKDEGVLYANNIRTNKEFKHKMETDPRVIADVGLFLNKTEELWIDKINEFYFGSRKPDFATQFSNSIQLNTDRWFAYGIYKTATLHSKLSPVQFYFYNKSGESLFDLICKIQGDHPPVSHTVCHADDIAMLFEMVGIFNVRQGNQHYQFSKDYVKAWASFASLKNVADVELRGEKFPILDPKGEVMVIEINDEPHVIKHPAQDRMRFWDSLHEQK